MHGGEEVGGSTVRRLGSLQRCRMSWGGMKSGYLISYIVG